MNKLDYEQIQTIQENITKKLIKYINEYIKKNKSLDSIEFYYPDLDEQKTKIAFNVWVSIDYKTDHGKSFIEHMLEDKSDQLSNLEKEILIERNKSFISLFEIMDIEGEYIYIADLLTGKKHTLWEPALADMLKASDLIFGRIGRIIEHKGFIGNISFLPPSVKDTFIEEIFIDYNRVRLRFSEMSIEKYLKQHSINVYRIYTQCIYEVIDMDEDISSILYDELDEFELYLQSHLSRPIIKKHITNLLNIFEYYLMEDELTLFDLDQIDIEYFFIKAIKDGFISSQRELSSYISTLKKFLGYLKNRNPIYSDAYNSIIEISKNRFLYMDSIIKNPPPFVFNRPLINGINNQLSEKAFEFIMDYEKFLLYIMSKPLKVTAKRKYIKRKDLLSLNEIMELRENVTKKAPNQEDFPLLDFFYRFSLENKLLKLEKDFLSLTKKSSHFLRLSDEEKYSLFIQYIWSDKFINFISKSSDCISLKKVKENILDLLNNLEVGIPYRYSSLLPVCIDFSEFLHSYYKYLELMGLLKYNYYPIFSIMVTSFGKMVFNILANKDKHFNDIGKIIFLDRYNRKDSKYLYQKE